MNNKSIAKPSIAAVLALTAALGPAWAQSSKLSLPAQTSGAEQTLTGTVGDSKCKGHTLGTSRLCDGDERCGVRPEWAQKRTRQIWRRARHNHRTRQWKHCPGRFRIIGKETGLAS